MEAEDSKTPGFSITAIVLFIVSLVTPQLIAPFLLVVAIITGLIGYSRKEWGGVIPLITAILSIMILCAVVYNLYTIQQKVSESLGKISKTENPFGEDDIDYRIYVEIIDIKAEVGYSYLTINGRIKNNGARTIKSCIIKVKAFDKNKDVVNTDKAHVFGDIEPNESKTFHSMMAWPKSAKTYSLSLEEVRVKK